MTNTAPKGKNVAGMSFHNSGERYWVKPLDKRSRKAIASQVSFGRKLVEAKVPGKVIGCRALLATWQAEANSLKLAGALANNSYRRLWLCRGWIIYALRLQGCTRLQVGRATVDDLMGLFPDEKQNLRDLLLEPKGRGTGASLQGKLRELGYTDPVEFLSMDACLFSDKAVVKFLRARPALWLEENRQGLIRARDAYRAMHGIYPHPAVLLDVYKSRR